MINHESTQESKPTIESHSMLCYGYSDPIIRCYGYSDPMCLFPFSTCILGYTQSLSLASVVKYVAV